MESHMDPTYLEPLRSLIAQAANVQPEAVQLAADDDFIVKYGIDSMSIVGLSLAISRRWKINFGETEEDIDSLRSVSLLIAAIRQRAERTLEEH